MRLDRGRPRFFNEHKVRSCAVLSAPLRTAIERFDAWSLAVRSTLERCQHVELREPDLDGLAGVEIVADVGQEQQMAERVRAMPPHDFSCWVRGSAEPPVQRTPIVDGCYTYVPLGSFRQVNTGLNAVMVRTVVDWLRSVGCQSFGDLYCGSGNLSLPLLVAGMSGWGVERDAQAIAALLRAADEQGVDASAFVAADAAEANGTSEALIIDPPRAGFGPARSVVDRAQPRWVVVLSCSVRGLERDLRWLLGKGFTARRVALCDMFVHTEHVEVVTLLARERGAAG
jgi:tRNA/tmRNA/rRNA uracil-C5-methylase (TrmA/RlmC/RlmD family)